MTITVGPLWFESLRPPAGAEPEAVCSPSIVAAAAARWGTGPTGWALHLGREIGRRSTERFADLTTAPLLVPMSQAVALALLDSMGRESVDLDLGVDLDRIVAECVHRRIGIEDVWRMMHQGHLWWVQAVSEAYLSVADDSSRTGIAELNEHVLLFMNALMDVVRNRYDTERTRWSAGREPARIEVAEAVLAGELTDLDRASFRLGYTIAFRHHVGLVAWSAEADRRADVCDAAHDLLRAWGAQQTLVLPDGASTVRAWGNRPAAFGSLAPGTVPPGIRVVVGCPGHDVEGFVSTHTGAREGREVLRRSPGVDDAVVTSRSLAMLDLVLSDADRADRFALAVLGPLAGAEHALLRETLAEFLSLRSAQAAADRLFVSRNTVNHRIRAAERLLGRSAHTAPTELALALAILAARPSN